MRHPDDTIAAIATPIGEGGIGIVRISGSKAKALLSHIFVSSNGNKTDSHKMLMGWAVNPSSKARVDQVMACYMKGPKTYTGEDVVELYCHGGAAIVKELLSIIIASGARLARRGEFTKRAFLNGKLDLTQAEAVLDLVKARTNKGAGYAVRQLEGKLSKAIYSLRKRIIMVMAALEAQIDFPEDVSELDYNALIQQLKGLRCEINEMIGSAKAGKAYRNGIATVIIGKPNVGKSCLLNALIDEARAIVTDLPGTTRDSIEETLDINGIPLRIIDTAGIRHPQNKAEEFGIERTESELSSADFALIVIDASKPLDEFDKMVLEKARGVHRILVLNKIDLGINIRKSDIQNREANMPIFPVSALYGRGIDSLKSGIFDILASDMGVGGDNQVYINTRHMECLNRAGLSLDRAIQSCNKQMAHDFITIDLKDALIALGEISGELVSEEVIITIFEQFCVGK